MKGWQGAAVQSTSATLSDALGDPERLKSFDVLLVGCDFSKDGTAENPTLQALRAVAADPRNPAVILLTSKGSEYTAVQAIKSGAFDYVPKTLLGREQVLSAVQRAMLHRKGQLGTRGSSVTGVVRLFGYDMRRCLATRDSVSVHVGFSAERGKEVVLKVLHRGRGALSRDANFERLVAEFKLLYDIARSCRRRNLRFPRHEPVLLHRHGVLPAWALGHAARWPAVLQAPRCATRARSLMRSRSFTRPV